MKRRGVSINILSALLLQVVTIISGLIVPKIILTTFGSDVNGLVSSINQFLNCISLLEGGLSGVVMANLYKPLFDRDNEKLNEVISASEHFFRMLALIYVAYVVIIALVYPRFVKSEFTPLYIAALIVVLGVNLFTQYYFSITWRLLLRADQRVYVVSLVQCIVTSLTIIATVITAKLYPSIIVIKLVGAAICTVQPIAFGVYVKKHYSLKKTKARDKTVLAQRWDSFGQNIAYYIHSNTDVVVLTLFASLAEVSVYTVYLMVISAMRQVISSVSSAIVPTIGNCMASGNYKKTSDAVDLYEFGIFFLTTFLFATGMVLIVPFVRVYTANVTDVSYIRPRFALLLLLAEGTYCMRDPYVSIAYAAGHFKQTKWYAYGEAFINIVLSILLVRRYGLEGVALGTLIAMTFRTVMQIYYLHGHILNRSMWNAIKIFALSLFSGAAIYFTETHLLQLSVTDYVEWFLIAVIASMISFVILIVISLVFFRRYSLQIIKGAMDKIRGRI